MLNVYLGSNYIFLKGKISRPSGYFDAVYEQSWLQSDMARYIIKTIDKSEYIDGEYIQSPVFGGISPRDLSTGCKALLILLNEPDKIVSGDRMGDNCYPVLLEMAKHADYTITLSHVISFKKLEPFEFCNARTGKKITNAIEFYQEYFAEDSRVDDTIELEEC